MMYTPTHTNESHMGEGLRATPFPSRRARLCPGLLISHPWWTRGILCDGVPPTDGTGKLLLVDLVLEMIPEILLLSTVPAYLAL